MSFLPCLSYDFDFAKAVVDSIQRDSGPYTVGRTVGPAYRRDPVFALHRPEKRAGCFLPAAGIGPPEGRRIRSDAGIAQDRLGQCFGYAPFRFFPAGGAKAGSSVFLHTTGYCDSRWSMSMLILCHNGFYFFQMRFQLTPDLFTVPDGRRDAHADFLVAVGFR